MNQWTHQLWKLIYKLTNFMDRIPGLKQLVSRPAVQSFRKRNLTRYVYGLPDRRYLEEQIIPAMLKAGHERILFVGCDTYTAHIPNQFEAAGVECYTTDILPEVAPTGNPDRHVVCDIADYAQHVPANHFDAVLFNGVLGHGVTAERMEQVGQTLHQVMRPNTYLLIGWNKGTVEDPIAIQHITDRFTHEEAYGLSARKDFPKSSHVYDWFRRRD